MGELDHKEGWAPKNWCFQTAVLEKTLQIPLDCKEIKPVNPKGNQSWIFIGRTDSKAEAPIVWPPDAKSRLIGKDPDAGKDWRQGEQDMTEDEMVEWRHWLNGHKFEQTLGDSEGQGGLECCSPWGHKSWTQLSDLTTATKLLHGVGHKLLLKVSWELYLGFCLLGCMTESHPPLLALGTLWSIPKQLTFYLKLAALSAISLATHLHGSQFWSKAQLCPLVGGHLPFLEPTEHLIIILKGNKKYGFLPMQNAGLTNHKSGSILLLNHNNNFNAASNYFFSETL